MKVFKKVAFVETLLIATLSLQTLPAFAGAGPSKGPKPEKESKGGKGKSSKRESIVAKDSDAKDPMERQMSFAGKNKEKGPALFRMNSSPAMGKNPAISKGNTAEAPSFSVSLVPEQTPAPAAVPTATSATTATASVTPAAVAVGMTPAPAGSSAAPAPAAASVSRGGIQTSPSLVMFGRGGAGLPQSPSLILTSPSTVFAGEWMEIASKSELSKASRLSPDRFKKIRIKWISGDEAEFYELLFEVAKVRKIAEKVQEFDFSNIKFINEEIHANLALQFRNLTTIYLSESAITDLDILNQLKDWESAHDNIFSKEKKLLGSRVVKMTVKMIPAKYKKKPKDQEAEKEHILNPAPAKATNQANDDDSSDGEGEDSAFSDESDNDKASFIKISEEKLLTTYSYHYF